MKPSFVALLVLALMRSASTSAQGGDLQAEFLRWKASPAGQIAYRDGHVPNHVSRTRGLVAADADIPSTEELLRFENAKAAIARLEQEQPQAKFTLDTPFALLTSDEFAAYVQKNDIDGFRKVLDEQVETATMSNSTNSRGNRRLAISERELLSAADVIEVDWTKSGCVNTAMDQGQCGVSWAFAAVAALESNYCITTGKLHQLSVQDVISCSNPTGLDACRPGGSSESAYNWIANVNGGSICTEATYPYASATGVAPYCRRTDGSGFTCTKPDLGAYFYRSFDVQDHRVLERLVSGLPVATLATTGVPIFQYYASGVIMGNEQACPSAKLDAALLVVGYGVIDGVPYWKVRNSWSKWWGQGGFAYVERGFAGTTTGACGVETQAYWPIFVDASHPGVDMRCSAQRTAIELTGETFYIESQVSAAACCNLCKERVGCVGYTWYVQTSACYLKASIDGETVNAAGGLATISGTLIAKSDATQQCSIKDNLDFPGNDVLTVLTTTAEECCDKCTAYGPCHAFTWSNFLGGSCYMKSKQPVVATAVSSPVTPPSLRSGTVYKCQPLKNNTDFKGQDIGNTNAATASECCGLCRATSECSAFSWTSYNGGTCWFKGADATRIAGAGVISASVN
ncbi:Cysteine protease family c01a, partial [Globisporangium splendens]